MKLLLFIFLSTFHSQTVIYFNGNNAMKYLQEQCDIGPRFPGSIGHSKAVSFYKEHFEKYSDSVKLYNDYVTHPHSLDSIKLTNIFSRFNPKNNNRILLWKICCMLQVQCYRPYPFSLCLKYPHLIGSKLT